MNAEKESTIEAAKWTQRHNIKLYLYDIMHRILRVLAIMCILPVSVILGAYTITLALPIWIIANIDTVKKIQKYTDVYVYYIKHGA